MRKNILLIGEARYLGKLFVQRLLQAGHQITLAARGTAPDPFGARVARIPVDRHDGEAMRAAFAAGAGYDIVYDMLCNSPLDAAIAVDVFAGKVKRYIMTSTIEVYRPLLGLQDTPFFETDLNVLAQPIDTRSPWHERSFAERNATLGKRQAEAYLYRDGRLPAVSVRIGHVLAGVEDAVGPLAHYVELARQYAPLRYSNAAAASSFLSAQIVSDFLVWAGAQGFKGPVNAACDGPLSAFDIFQKVGEVLDIPVSAVPSSCIVQARQLSPFDYASPYLMDNTRARELGYRFGHSDEWLDDLIRQHDLEFV